MLLANHLGCGYSAKTSRGVDSVFLDAVRSLRKVHKKCAELGVEGASGKEAVAQRTHDCVITIHLASVARRKKLLAASD